MPAPILIAADHAGFELKESLKKTLERRGLEYRDLGTDSVQSVDYPDFAHRLAEAISKGEAERGVLVCGTGQGMAMSANRHPGVRAALAPDEETARLSREHNNANVLTMGARLTTPYRAERVLEVFLDTPFAGGRHEGRVTKIDC
jgi:ribose 5-phosphate isomerase B